jgi:hypothetical protein
MEEYGVNGIQAQQHADIFLFEVDRTRENGNIQFNEDADMEEEFLDVTGCSSES